MVSSARQHGITTLTLHLSDKSLSPVKSQTAGISSGCLINIFLIQFLSRSEQDSLPIPAERYFR
jgi:hypothetical protein